MLGPDFQQFGTKLRIRGEATSYNQRLRIVLLAAAHRLLGEYSRHGIRQRRAHVIDGNLIALRLLFLDPTRDGRFHAGKAEIVRMLLARFALGEPLRNFDGMWVAQLRMTVDMRTARIWEAQ